MNHQTHSLPSLLASIGQAGQRLSSMDATEGAAGNISLCFPSAVDVTEVFSLREDYLLPVQTPALAGRQVLVTGSGSRLRDVLADPAGNLAVIQIGPDGRAGTLLTAPGRNFERVTSEFNSHLSVHDEQLGRKPGPYHAVVHAQPLRLTFLSHVPRYQNAQAMNDQLLRWQPEAILNFPEGFSVLPFMVPGSAELAQANREALRDHPLVVWSGHGVMARSDSCVLKATDLIEYAETSARYECLNVQLGGLAAGLSGAQMAQIAAAYGVPTSLVSLEADHERVRPTS